MDARPLASHPTRPAGVNEAAWSTALGSTPRELRHLVRSGAFAAPTSGLCPGYAQANLIVLPKEQAFDFLRREIGRASCRERV